MTPSKLPVGTRVTVTTKDHSGYKKHKEWLGTVKGHTPSGYKVMPDKKPIIIIVKNESVSLEGK